MQKLKLAAITIATLTFITACGGSSDNDPKTQEAPAPVFSMAISDAPIDDLSEVIVCFNTVELKSSNGDSTFTVGVDPQMLPENDLCIDNSDNVVAETRGINLLEYQGMQSIQLLSGLTIEEGEYSQIRLGIGEGSYATVKSTQDKVALRVPSNELKLDGFTAALGSRYDFTLEFELRKAMTNPVGQDNYILKPRGVRLVDNAEIGHIEGTVAESLLFNTESCLVAPSDTDTTVAVVYLYEGVSLNIDNLGDNGGGETLEPVASTSVNYDGVQTYSFEIGFVTAGDYTLSLSCDTFDDPEADDDITLIQTVESTVTTEQTPTQVDFQ